jgi:hypothetical protein
VIDKRNGHNNYWLKELSKGVIHIVIDEQEEKRVTRSGDASSLVTTDSPDDFAYEGRQDTPGSAKKKKTPGDKAYVTVDSPDDFE